MILSKHKISMAAFDIILIFAGFHSAFWFVFASGICGRPHSFPRYYAPSLVLISAIFLTIFQLEGLYKYQAITNPIHQLQSLLKCYLKCLAAVILIIFFFKTGYIADSRLTIGLGFLISFLFMVLARAIIIPKLFYYLVTTGRIRKRVLILGAGQQGSRVCTFLEHNPKNYFQVVGFADDHKRAGSRVCGKEVFGNSYELENIISSRKIEEIILAINNISRGALLDLIDRCKRAGLVIHVVSDLFSRVTEKIEAEEFGGLMTFRIVPRQTGIIHRLAKRAVDLIASAVLCTLLSPLFLIIALFIKWDSEGPVFYTSRVVGRGGKTFVSYKFRSMLNHHADNRDEQQKYEAGKNRHLQFMESFIQGRTNGEFFVKDESRITKVGRFLRKHSLDELPQLINVFRGEMSLVGPRFCSVEEYQFYKPWHKRRFQVKPGITGLWQVRGRSEVSYDDMVILDLYYIQNCSFLFDLEILLRTVSVVFTGKGSRVSGGNSKNTKMNERELTTDESTFCGSADSVSNH
ncbi:MAG: sugar transferase [bacterium]